MKWWIYRDNRISEKAYPRNELKDLPSLSGDTLVCSVRGDDWQALSEVPNLRDLVETNGNGNHRKQDSFKSSRRYPHFTLSDNGTDDDSSEPLDVREDFLQWDGDPVELRNLHLKTLLLSLITVGLYYFWGKHKLTQYVLENARVDDQPFRYDGSPLDRFVGTIITGALTLAVATACYGAWEYLTVDVWSGVPLVAATGVLLIGLYQTAKYRTRGYFLNNLSLGQFDFSQVGSSISIGVGTVSRYVLTVLSLGLYYPYYRHWKLNRLANNTVFNGESFEYTGEPRYLLNSFLQSWLRFGLLPFVAVLSLGGLFHTFLVTGPDFILSAPESRVYASVWIPVIIFTGIGCSLMAFTAYHQREFTYVLRNLNWNEARFSLNPNPRDFSRLNVFAEGISWLTVSLSDTYFTSRKITYFKDNLEVDHPVTVEGGNGRSNEESRRTSVGPEIPTVQFLGLVRF